MLKRIDTYYSARNKEMRGKNNWEGYSINSKNRASKMKIEYASSSIR
jgi:hypothetical protein